MWQETAEVSGSFGGSYSGARAYRSSEVSFQFLQVAGRGGFQCSLLTGSAGRGGSSMLRRYLLKEEGKHEIGATFLSLTGGMTRSFPSFLSPHELEG